ncbi:MAG TPA: enoyl-CoA hydratase/isomerase family protein, partial [Burkholderiales bacterium]|nr:enoyl-CoA hydratase/isomerase family protein [Burkholderiales bacterium]
MTSPITLAVVDGVARITLDVPGRLNSLSVPGMTALRESLERAAADPAVRCVLVTGAGTAFCAGADVRAMRETHDHPTLFRALTHDFHGAISAISHTEKPVVAAVNGVAAGGGFALMLACDLRLAADTAKLKPGYATLGVVPDGGTTWTLSRLNPAAAARIL